MSLKPQTFDPVPAETARITKAAFPQGNTYITDGVSLIQTNKNHSSY
jgi:hypothetical protein